MNSSGKKQFTEKQFLAGITTLFLLIICSVLVISGYLFVSNSNIDETYNRIFRLRELSYLVIVQDKDGTENFYQDIVQKNWRYTVNDEFDTEEAIVEFENMVSDSLRIHVVSQLKRAHSEIVNLEKRAAELVNNNREAALSLLASKEYESLKDLFENSVNSIASLSEKELKVTLDKQKFGAEVALFALLIMVPILFISIVIVERYYKRNLQVSTELRQAKSFTDSIISNVPNIIYSKDRKS